MRIRTPFAAAFAVILLASAFLGLTPRRVDLPNLGRVQGDKVLHFFTFFILTLAFYWIIETSRRKILQLTLLICTGLLAVGSELLQALLPNGRDLDLFDIVANIAGSGAAVALCAWYHRRMLERKRASKRYGSLGGDEEDGMGPGPAIRDGDLELQEGTSAQELGITHAGQTETNLDAELDNWDENAEDWDDGDANGDSKADEAATKRRAD